MEEEDSSLHSGPEGELGKSCCCPPFQVVIAESWSPTYKLQHFEQRESQESLKIRDLLPFAVSHNKVVKVSEDTGNKSFKFGNLEELSNLY
jgi:hypothetical protein